MKIEMVYAKLNYKRSMRHCVQCEKNLELVCSKRNCLQYICGECGAEYYLADGFDLDMAFADPRRTCVCRNDDCVKEDSGTWKQAENGREHILGVKCVCLRPDYCEGRTVSVIL